VGVAIGRGADSGGDGRARRGADRWRGGAALFVLFALHQLMIGVRVALHASWLAKALRAVDYAHRVVRAP
jgi:hypothetical protein